MPETTTKERRGGAVSLRILAAGIVIAFCYWAAGLVITVLTSVLLAYFVDPLVELLERFRIPRTAGALIAVLLALALVTGTGWLLWDRVNDFAEAWPKYRAVLAEFTSAIEQRIEQLEARFKEITPKEKRAPQVILQDEGFTVRGLLWRGLGSLYTLLLLLTFVPFLVYFMLAAKRDVWHATLQLFPPTERTQVKRALEAVSGMLRSYIAGSVIVVGIVAVLSWIFFWIIGLDYPFLTGMVSGTLNLVPYIGVVLAWLPPLVIGLTKFNTLWPFVGIAAVLSFFHLIAINVLIPVLVGKKVQLSALAVTVALLFWGWLWGAMGFILAVPITATIKVICDHVEGWQPMRIWGMGIASHDVTGDGLPEVFLTSQSDNKLQTLAGDRLRPEYTDIAFSRGVTAHRPYLEDAVLPATAWHADFQDVNNDGLIDLYISKGNVESQPDFAAEDPNNLLLGNPDGTFTEGAPEAGIVNPSRTRGAALADFNLDGLLDLVEVNRRENIDLWRNVGSGSVDAPAPMGDWLAIRLDQPAPNVDAIGSWIEVRTGNRTLQREVTIGGGHAGGQLGWLHFGVGDADTVEVRVQWPDGDSGGWMNVRSNRFVTIERDGNRVVPWPVSDD